jgi:hypothetical protein
MVRASVHVFHDVAPTGNVVQLNSRLCRERESPMTLLAGFLVYVGLMTVAVAFLRFVRFCDDDVRVIHERMDPSHQEDFQEAMSK